jgi:hypothetical protein
MAEVDSPSGERRQRSDNGADEVVSLLREARDVEEIAGILAGHVDPGPRKKKRKKRPLAKRKRLLLILCGAAGLLLVVPCCAGVAISLLFMKRGDANDPTAQGHTFEVATSSSVAKDPKHNPPGAVFPFSAAPPAEGPLPAASGNWPKWTRPVPPKWPVEEFIDGDGVPVPLGSPPQRPTFASGLLIPLGRMAIAPGTKVGALFSPDARYALGSSQLGPVCVQKFVDDPEVPGRRFFTAVDPKKPQPPHTLYDLSSGKPRGEYPGNMPLSVDGRLSPGGEYCVTRAWEQMPDLTKSQSFWLDVWKQGEPKVTGQIAPTGNVRWAEFISATRLAIFQQEPDPALVVWDVATRKVATRIPATLGPKIAPPKTDRQPVPTGAYVPNPHGGAVAPGGRFIAIGGPTAIIVFDLKEGKEHGRFPIRGNAGIGSFSECGFLTGPNRLVARLGPSVSAWDLTTGKLTHATTLGTPGAVFRGRLDNGPEGKLQSRNDRLVRFGLDVTPLAAPSGGPSPFVSTIFDRSRLPMELLKRVVYEWAELDLIYTWKMEDKASDRADVPVYEPFQVPARRPEVAMGNRGGVTVKQPAPPAAWQRPPAAEWTKPEAGAWLPEWPAAIGGSQGAVIRYVQIDKPVRPYGTKQRYFQMIWDRYDLSTGKRLGSPLALWPWANDPSLLPENPAAQIPTPPPTTCAALTADGETLAVVDPNEPHRIDLWNTKGQRTGYYAAAEGAVIQWLGWSADGKLLSLASGVLTAWDARAAKALWEVSGGYRLPSELARGSKWGAFHAGSHVDLIDTTSGQCLGRCRVQQSIADPVALSLSPDARRLLVVTKRPQFTRSLDGAYEFYSGTLWDLTTGAAQAVPFGTTVANKFNDMHSVGWITPDHFIGFFLGLDVYDIRAKGMVAQFNPSENSTSFFPKKPWYRATPDGRVWLHAQTKKRTEDIRDPQAQTKKRAEDIPGSYAWIPVTLPSEAAPLFDPNRSYVEIPKQPLQVEVDFRDSQRSKRAAQAVADVLSSRGYTIGQSPWKIRVAFEVSDKHISLTHPGGGETKIFGALLKWSLVSPAGGEPVWKWLHEKSMLAGSKFAAGTKISHEGLPIGQSLVITQFDFGGRDPMTALTEEFLERMAGAPEVPGNIARWALVGNGQAQPLPLAGVCRIPAE